MNLKLLLTAALSTAALAAHADVQLYGSIKSGIETSQTRFGGQTRSSTAVADQGSHIGLRGAPPPCGALLLSPPQPQEKRIYKNQNRPIP